MFCHFTTVQLSSMHQGVKTFVSRKGDQQLWHTVLHGKQVTHMIVCWRAERLELCVGGGDKKVSTWRFEGGIEGAQVVREDLDLLEGEPCGEVTRAGGSSPALHWLITALSLLAPCALSAGTAPKPHDTRRKNTHISHVLHQPKQTNTDTTPTLARNHD